MASEKKSNKQMIEKTVKLANEVEKAANALKGIGKKNRKQQRAPLAINRTVKLTNRDVTPVHHRELVKTFSASDLSHDKSLNVIYYPLNLGIPETFPWAHKQAVCFETYRFTSLHVEWVGGCPATTAGRVLMAVDYDPNDPIPGTESQLANYKDSVASDVWSNCVMKCNMHDSRNPAEFRFVRTTDKPVVVIGDQMALYDLGSLYIAFPNMSHEDYESALTLGSVYISFSAELKTPQMDAPEDDTVNGHSIMDHAGMNFYGTTTKINIPNATGYINVYKSLKDAEPDPYENWHNEKATPTTLSWPLQFYEDVYVVDWNGINEWEIPLGCQALSDCEVKFQLGFQNQLCRTLNTTTNGSKTCNIINFAYHYPENRRGWLECTSCGGQSGSHGIEGIGGGEHRLMGDTNNTVEHVFKLKAGEWVCFSTAAGNTPSNCDAQLTCASDYERDDQHWWEIALDVVSVVAKVIGAVVSIFLLPAAVQNEIKATQKRVIQRQFEILSEGKMTLSPAGVQLVGENAVRTGMITRELFDKAMAANSASYKVSTKIHANQFGEINPDIFPFPQDMVNNWNRRMPKDPEPTLKNKTHK